MDVVTYALLSGKVSSVESMVTSLAEGFAYKGSKSSVSALPDDAGYFLCSLRRKDRCGYRFMEADR